MKKIRTPFGKQFKILRVQHDEDITDAAKFLGVSASYITCVEHGERDIPKEWIDKIINHYHLSRNDKNKLIQSARESPCHLKIDLSDLEKSLMNFIENVSNGDEKFKLNGQIRIRTMMDELRKKK